MLNKNFILLIIIASSILNIQAKQLVNNIESNSSKSELLFSKLQILAKTIETKKNIIIASGDVLIHSPSYYITAQKVIYNKEKNTLELFDNVNIIKDSKITTFTNYAFLDFSKEIDLFKPILVLDNTNNIWINSIKADKQSNNTTFKDATLSSCDCYNPAWSLSFTSGDYNTSNQWINTYNTTLFINEVPVFYVPYFGFPTDTTRRTGLLKPTIGWSKDEGLLYAQPMYYAPSLDTDFEYIPQVRLQRGKGHHIKARFKDSDVSLLKLQTGIFKEDNVYFEESDLLNNKHYGWDLSYKRDKLFSKTDEHQDGLLLSLHNLNDIDYINTQIDNKNDDTDKLVESNLKYFYNSNELYGDIDLKYYKDTSKINNDDTMHELPKINLHKYSTSILLDNLFYSSDLQYSNKKRTIGLNAQSTQLFVPLTYSHKLLDDYLNIAYSEKLSILNINYHKNSNNYQDGKFFENKHIISLSTYLLKPYTNYIHAISFDTTVTIPNTIEASGDLYSINNNDDELSVFPIQRTQKNIDFTFNQSFFNKSNLSKLLTHSISQPIVYKDNSSSRLSNLENELILYYKYGEISNQLLFNHQENMIISSSSTISFLADNFTSNIYYSYSKDSTQLDSTTQSYSYNELPNAEAFTFDLSYKVYKYYTIMYKEEYDLVTEVSKKKEYTLNIDKKCWAMNFKVADNLVAAATTSNNAIRQNIFYINFTLKPILSINQEYIKDKK